MRAHLLKPQQKHIFHPYGNGSVYFDKRTNCTFKKKQKTKENKIENKRKNFSCNSNVSLMSFFS